MALSSGGKVRRRSVLVLLVLTALTLMTLDQQRGDAGPIGAAGRLASDVVGPIRDGVHTVAAPIGDWFGGVFSAGSTKRENDRLRNQLTAQETELARAADAIRQNQELQKLLGLTPIEKIHRTAAQVIAGAPGNFEHSVIIDKGSSSGVRVGMPVVAAGGLFGRVVTVGSHQSKVLLATDAEFAVSVRTTNGRNVAIASGQGNALLRLDFVQSTGAPSNSIAVGDTIVTSGLQRSLYPSGIPVGRVVAVGKRTVLTAPAARVKPYVDFDTVEFVEVLDWAGA